MKKYLFIFLFFPLSLYAQGFTGFRTITISGATTGWQDDGNTVRLVNTADTVVIGNTISSSGAKFAIRGMSDQPQAVIRGHSTQTQNILTLLQNDADVLFHVTNNGSALHRMQTTGIGLVVGGSAGGTQIQHLINSISNGEIKVNDSGGFNMWDIGDATNGNLNGGLAGPFGQASINLGGATFSAVSHSNCYLTKPVSRGTRAFEMQDTDASNSFIVVLNSSGNCQAQLYDNAGVLRLNLHAPNTPDGNSLIEQNRILFTEAGGTDYSLSTDASTNDINFDVDNNGYNFKIANTQTVQKSNPFFISYEGTPAGVDSSIEIDVESGNAVIRGNSAIGGSSDIAWQGDSLNFSFASNGYKFKSGDIFYGTDVVLVNNAVSAGSNAFTTTATTDTVIVSGSATTDLYWIQLTGTGAPAATDAHKVEARSGSFVVHRGAAGTSGLTYNWKREKP